MLKNNLLAALFVFLWSSGFFIGKMAVMHFAPLSLLLVRYVLSSLFFVTVVWLFKIPWAQKPSQIMATVITALLVHVFYLGAVFIALDYGLDAGMVTLIAAMQPLFTVIFAWPVLKEKTSALQVLGIVLGLMGVFIALQNSLQFSSRPWGYAVAFAGTFFLSMGVLIEKKFCRDISLMSSLALQYIVASLALAITVPFFENPIALFFNLTSWGAWFSLAWLTLLCSVVSYLLLFYLTRQNSATRVSSLIYLTPPVAMLVSYFLFGETLSYNALLGALIVLTGIFLVNWKR